MVGENRKMSGVQFALGLLAIAVALIVAELTSSSEGTGSTAETLGFGFGGVVGGVVWGLIVWGLMRLGAGKDKPLDGRKIVFITTAVIAGVYLILRLMG